MNKNFNNEKILVTGCAGFIGFHLSKSLLDDGFKVFGVDNLNTYYDVELKKDRLDILNAFSNFSFYKKDISKFGDISEIFQSSKPDKVVNLAAQAGVRYSIENPLAYVNSNLVGFVNIIELCKEYSVKGLIYASSSSVYGGNTKTPFSVEDRVNLPISLYAASKRSNELIAHSYSHLFKLNTTGLRFFTVYGPWGRPDMAMYIFADRMFSDKHIDVYNNGNMKRDFTYISDIVSGIRSSIDKNYQCEIFNIGNSKSVDLMDVIACIEKNLSKKSKINFLPMQKGDVKKTFSDIDRTIEMLNYKPTTNIEDGIKKFINWFKLYNKIN